MAELFITNDQARALLKARCAVHGSIRALAAQTGTAPCSISTMLAGNRPVSKAVAQALGLKAVKGFVKDKDRT
jgi:hypothetical protein